MAAILAASFSLSSCNMGGAGTTVSGNSNASAVGSALGNLIGNFIGANTELSASSMKGTWKYTGTKCVFESENLLMKAGGAVAASALESKLDNSLAKFGISKSACSFTFNSDNTYTATIGGRTISGTYTVDAKNKTVDMTYLAGLAHMKPQVSISGNSMSLAFEADKILKLLETASSLTGGAQLKTVSSLLSKYDGMLVGIQLSK